MIDARPGAQVTVSCDEGPRATDVVWTSAMPGVGSLILPLNGPQAVSRAHVLLNATLMRLKEETLPKGDMAGLVDGFGDLGRNLMNVLFGADLNRLNDLQAFWRASFPSWQCLDHSIRVELVGAPQVTLPIEYLPLFDRHVVGKTSSTDALAAEVFRAFVGYSCVVSRQLKAGRPGLASNTLGPAGSDSVSVGFLIHDGLEGARAELEMMRTAGPRLNVAGPLPEDRDSVTTIAEYLTSTHSDHYDVLHFSCHCDARASIDALSYSMRLQNGGKQMTVAYSELISELYKLPAASPGLPSRLLPVVVLNACGTSKVDPSTSMAFPKTMLELGNRAIVGTQIPVADNLAMYISTEMYEELLSGGATLGEALLRAKWTMLQRYGDPFGLTYVLYGDDTLTVA